MASRLPSTFRKLVGTKVTANFKEAVELVTKPLPTLGPKDILVKNRFVGINASDINYTAARYGPHKEIPYDVGFEGVGEVAAVGSDCKHIKPGQPITYMQYGAFSEYIVIPAKMAIPVPNLKAEYLSLPVSGLTAAISLDVTGEIKKGETVLVTAAAGGTGQFAVQLAKNAGCHVIGTCSSQEKVDFLKKIGCDRPINYTTENLRKVLKEEYPKGVDVVYETIGADIFDACVDNLAIKGRLVVIGYISGYESSKGFVPSRTASLPAKVLGKSSSVRGFLLFHYAAQFPEYMQRLIQAYGTKKISIFVDNGKNSPTGPFKGLESIPSAVEYLYSKKNIGKIYVELPEVSSNL